MTQNGVGQLAGDHRFADWRDSDAHSWVVAAFGHDLRTLKPRVMVWRGEMEPAAEDRPILIG